MNIDLSTLYSLGLTPREAEVYVCLVKTGECGMGNLIEQTGLRPQVAYDTVRRLVSKELAFLSDKKGKQYVTAASPTTLEEMSTRQLEKVKTLVPNLLLLGQEPKDAVVRIERGNEAVMSLRRRAYEQLQPGDCYYIIGGSGDRFYETIGMQQYVNIENSRAKRGVEKRLVTFDSQRQGIIQGELGLELATYRFLPFDYPTLTSTNVYGNTVAEIIWSDVPLVILINGDEIAESYKNYFKTLWEMAQD